MYGMGDSGTPDMVMSANSLHYYFEYTFPIPEQVCSLSQRHDLLQLPLFHTIIKIESIVPVNQLVLNIENGKLNLSKYYNLFL